MKPWMLAVIAVIALAIFLLGWRLGHGGTVVIDQKPLPQVVAFDSALVAARADSIARADERAQLRAVLQQLVAQTAAVQHTIQAAGQLDARYHDLRGHVLATAASCGDSVRVLLTADSLCRARGDSLAGANARLLQINREGQLAADHAVGMQMIAEGKYSQFRNEAIDAVTAIGTRLDEVLRGQRPQPKWTVGALWEPGRAVPVGGYLSRNVGPLVLSAEITQAPGAKPEGRLGLGLRF